MLKIVLIVSLCAVAFSCESFSWRGHLLFCCQNGTYTEVNGVRVWSAARPSVCGAALPSDDCFDWPAFLLIVVSVVCCIKQMQFCTAYIVYKLSK